MTRKDQAVRARQGAGARYDAAAAPHEHLLLARRGAAYFARKLNELRDEDMRAPSRRAGWSRAHLVVHVSYHARALARLVEWARTGVEQPIYASAAARDEEIALGATLPSRALRNLFHHAAIHLDVERRDLPDKGWAARLRLLDAADITARETPLLRADEVWKAAIDLDNGGQPSDLPTVIRSRCDDPNLPDGQVSWSARETKEGGRQRQGGSSALHKPSALEEGNDPAVWPLRSRSRPSTRRPGFRYLCCCSGSRASSASGITRTSAARRPDDFYDATRFMVGKRQYRCQRL